jgi:hypothetical protein
MFWVSTKGVVLGRLEVCCVMDQGVVYYEQPKHTGRQDSIECDMEDGRDIFP